VAGGSTVTGIALIDTNPSAYIEGALPELQYDIADGAVAAKTVLKYALIYHPILMDYPENLIAIESM